MKKLTLLLLFFTSLSFCNEWKWAGFEIVGSRSVSVEKIAEAIPLTLGTPFKLDFPTWKKWCDDVKQKFDFAHVGCSAVRFIDFKAYFEVNIVEKGEEYRLKYREIPSQEVTIAAPTLYSQYDALMKHLWSLFDKGISAGEFTNGDFVDYKNKEMHEMVLKIVALAPQHRKNIIEVLKNHKDSEKRATSAWLLCWALSPIDSIQEVYPLVDDPDMNVRNNISRFMDHWIAKVAFKEQEPKFLDAMVLQMKRPSHADRNKALLTLFNYLSTHKEALDYFKKIGKNEVDHIAQVSILSNVGGVAKDIQKLYAK